MKQIEYECGSLPTLRQNISSEFWLHWFGTVYPKWDISERQKEILNVFQDSYHWYSYFENTLYI